MPVHDTPSHCPHPYFFCDPPRSPATLSRQSYHVFSFAQFSNSSIIYLCFSITSRLIDLFATDSQHLVHISTTFRSRSPPTSQCDPSLPPSSIGFLFVSVFCSWSLLFSIYISVVATGKTRKTSFPLSLLVFPLFSLSLSSVAKSSLWFPHRLCRSQDWVPHRLCRSHRLVSVVILVLQASFCFILDIVPSTCSCVLLSSRPFSSRFFGFLHFPTWRLCSFDLLDILLAFPTICKDLPKESKT